MRSIVLIVLAVFDTASAGFEHREVGGRSRGLGGAYSGLAGDVYSIVYNVGALSQLATNEISWYDEPQPFGINEISFQGLLAGLPAGSGVLGLFASRFGYDYYHETVLGCSFAKQFDGIGIGISCSYCAVAIRNYGSAGTIALDAGFYLSLVPGVSSGIALRNINSPAIGSSGEKLPRGFSIGAAYKPNDSFSMAVDYQKEDGFDAAPKVGFEYWIIPAVAVRAGMSDVPSQTCCGIGVAYSFAGFDYAASHHDDLGWSHHVSLTVHW